MVELTKAQFAGQALDDLFGDMSVPSNQTRKALEMLREHIDGMLAALDEQEGP